MHIKQICIQGFKSYKDQTEMESFDPGLNAVVGRNGSGKSNFFAAIRFVLSDSHSNMSREERQALLHEGVGPSTVNAYVEVIFDNSDNRFPTGRPEVILRRTIGLKKDEYQLDKKSVPKSEVMSLLESAGFSRSNPYYIVPQGRIISLCNAKDSERLQLLKDVAGTRVYEQRRKESLKIMEETECKRTKIQELLSYIEERLNELDEEKEELRNFYELDKERKGVEFAIYNRENKEISEELQSLEEERSIDIEKSKQKNMHAKDRQKLLADFENDMNDLKQNLDSKSLERKQLNEELQVLIRRRADLELKHNDIASNQSSNKSKKSHLVKEMKQLKQQIRIKNDELDKILFEYNSLYQEEQRVHQKNEEMSFRREILSGKQGRYSKFKTVEERNAYIEKEIKMLEKKSNNCQQLIKELSENFSSSEKQERELGQSLNNSEVELEKLKQEIRKRSERIQQLNSKQIDLATKKRSLWRDQRQLVGAQQHTSSEYKSSVRGLSSMMDKATSMGLESVKKIAERLKLDGVYGPLYELIDVEEVYHVAVDVIAGASLFHVVVDNDETVERIIEVLNREKSGRVTFIPLNRMKLKDIKYPDVEGAIPLIDKIRHDPKFKPAIQQAFGKTVVCADLDIAATVASSYNINAITLDGDKVEKRGALTGGHVGSRRTRLKAVVKANQLKLKMNAIQTKLEKMKLEIDSIDADCNGIYTEITNLESERRSMLSSRDLLKNKIDSSINLLESLKHGKHAKHEQIDKEQKEYEFVLQKLAHLKQEAQEPLCDSLSSREKKELEQLNKIIPEIQKELGSLYLKRSAVESTKQQLESELSIQLVRKEKEIQEILDSTADDDEDVTSSNSALIESELKKIIKSISLFEKTLNELDEEIDEAKTRVQEITLSIENLSGQNSEDIQAMEEQQKRTQKYVSRKSLLTQKKDDCSQKIKELGALSEDIYEKYDEHSTKMLIKELHSLNEKLKKFGHVNKKAYEQFNNFTDQRNNLIHRKRELDTSAKAIADLMDILDQRKNEAIERTFQQVSTQFAEIFQKLVPSGKGELEIQRRMDQIGGDSISVDTENPEGVDSYTGISIKISFNSKSDEGLLMSQLSGGQKSLVSLALIFSIQKCDPAPFYLFDEIDANLDAAYRSSVAAMISELSQNAQFIVTTFRPEMLQHARKFYGVSFRDGLSNIDVITKEGAMNFVEQVSK